MLVMFAPFFIFIFGPLLQYNILVGSIVGGIYLGFCFNAGAPAVEAFIEKSAVAVISNLVARGCLAVLAGRCVPRLSASCSPSIIVCFLAGFWLCTHPRRFTLFAKTDAPSSATVANAVGANHSAFSQAGAGTVQTAKTVVLSLYVIGVSCTYDVFDQQFANFFTSFLLPVNRVRGYLAT